MSNPPDNIIPFDGSSDGLPKRRFQTIPVGQFAGLPDQEWIIEEIIPQAELAVIYGEPGCGKTFMVIDMAFAIARGIEWEHKITAQGRVIYICAEALAGVKKRTYAYGRHHGVDLNTIPLDIITDTPNFLKGVDCQLLAKSIMEGDSPKVIIVDTFSRTMVGGNENSSEHAGHAISQCKVLHDLTGAIVLLIHHSGKDSERGSRGWSGLLGACDTEIEITRVNTVHKAHIHKQKDGEDGIEWGFDLMQIDLGENSRGKLITSCVYMPLNAVPIEEKTVSIPSPKGHNQLKAMEVFAQYQANNSLAFDEFIRLLAREMPNDGESEERHLKANAKRTILALITKEVLDIDNNIVHKV